MAKGFAHAGLVFAAAVLRLSSVANGQSVAPAQPVDQPGPAPSALPGPAPAVIPSAPQPGTLPEVDVEFSDGKRVSGQLVERTETELILRIAGIDTKFPLSEVSEVRARPPIEAQYRTLRDSIDNNDVERLIRLAEWLFQKKKYDLALAEIDHVLHLEADNPNARDLRTLIVAQKAINEAGRKAPVPVDPAAPKEERFVFPLLSEENINLIRVFELDMTRPSKFVIKRDVVEKFADTYAERIFRVFNAEQRADYIRSDPKRIVKDMFALRAREFYPEIKVLENPPSMKRFRDDVHRRWLSNSCATSQCHGGEDAGRLWLFSGKSGSDDAAYTNFLILDRYRTEAGRPLIDFDKPSQSLLLQFGLPRDKSLTPHPDVANFGRNQKWRPVFKGEDDPDFIKAMEWIGSMTKPHVDYPIDYDPPRPRAAQIANPDIIDHPQPR